MVNCETTALQLQARPTESTVGQKALAHLLWTLIMISSNFHPNRNVVISNGDAENRFKLFIAFKQPADPKSVNWEWHYFHPWRNWLKSTPVNAFLVFSQCQINLFFTTLPKTLVYSIKRNFLGLSFLSPKVPQKKEKELEKLDLGKLTNLDQRLNFWVAAQIRKVSGLAIGRGCEIERERERARERESVWLWVHVRESVCVWVWVDVCLCTREREKWERPKNNKIKISNGVLLTIYLNSNHPSPIPFSKFWCHSM